MTEMASYDVSHVLGVGVVGTEVVAPECLVGYRGFLDGADFVTVFAVVVVVVLVGDVVVVIAGLGTRPPSFRPPRPTQQQQQQPKFNRKKRVKFATELNN